MCIFNQWLGNSEPIKTMFVQRYDQDDHLYVTMETCSYDTKKLIEWSPGRACLKNKYILSQDRQQSQT